MLRILHTSDWHIGIEINGFSRLLEQGKFLDWLLSTCKDKDINLLLIAGDIYDVANPSILAIDLFSKFIADFKKQLPNSQIIAISGNHDSGARLELSRHFTNILGGIHLIGSFDKNCIELSKWVIPINVKNIQLGWCIAIPFLRPSELDTRIKGDETPEDAYNRALAELYTKCVEYAKSKNSNIPIIGMGHLTILGSSKAGSERVLIGGLDSISSNCLSSEMEYVALGHIHRGQRVTSIESLGHIEYSGSPLPMDFNERNYKHRVKVITFINKKMELEDISVPQFVDYIRFCEPPIPFDKIEEVINSYNWEKYNNTPVDLRPFVDIHYLSDKPLGTIRERVEKLVKDKPIRLVSTPTRIGSRDLLNINRHEVSIVEDKSPEDILMYHLQQNYGMEHDSKMVDKFREILAEVYIGGNK